jgi:spermidine/putrescine transport system permease protein
MTPNVSLQSSETGRPATRAAWLLFAPLGAWLVLFIVAPTFILFVYSFFHGIGVREVQATFTPGNYARVFGPAYLRIFGRSILYAGATTVLCALIGYPVAYYIGRADERRRNRLLLLVMIPFWTSFLIRTFAWYTILQRQGLLNGLLEALHIIPTLLHAPIELLYSPTAVMITLVYTYLPFMILPIYASVEKLDNSLLEAASDLGAGPMQTFRRVTLPLTGPGIAAGVIMVFVPAIAMFAVTNLMSGGKVRLIGDEIEKQFYSAGDLPFGSALGMTLLALFMLTFWLATRSAAKGK